MPKNSRKRYNRQGSSNAGWVVILVLVIGLAVYFGAAGVAGDWLAKNVVSPMMGWLGIWDEDAQTTGTPEPSASSTQEKETAAQDANADSGIEVAIEGLHVYFLQTGAFESKGNAEDEAQTLQGRGGAGYVAEDGEKYRVFLATYTEKKDADSVNSNLAADDVEARVHVVECNGAKINVASKEQKNALESGLKKYLSGVSNLQQACLSIEDETKMREQAKAAYEDMGAVKTEIDKGMASGENAFADDIYELSGNIATELEGDALSAQAVQHAYAHACFRYIQLANAL